MISLRRLRHQLGLYRYHLLAATLGRHRARAAQQIRKRIHCTLSELPTIHLHAHAALEVHMLCGADSVDMGIWASWSLLRFVQSGSFYLHGDPSLTPAHLAPWHSLLRGIRPILTDEGSTEAAKLCAPFPSLGAFRAHHPLARKLIDFHLFGDCRHILLLDSDVLTFRRPDEVLACPPSSGETFARWNRDIRSSYACEPHVMRSLTSKPVPSRFNSGLLLMSRLTADDFVKLDHLLAQLVNEYQVDPRHPWLEQTLYALVVGNFADTGPFSVHYDLLGGFTRSPECQHMRHYPGNALIRPKYWTEGLPRILATF